MVRRGGYGAMLAGRFGRIIIPDKKVGSKRIWIQAVSVGELLAIESLLKSLNRLDSVEIVLTTTTSTGYTLAKEKYGDLTVAIESFPLDFIGFVRKSWKRINPDVAVITEGELWPEHIHTAKQLGVPLVLINARLSDKSYRRMLKTKGMQSLFYRNITAIGASSEWDAQRISDLGFDQGRMTVSGNLKFDVVDPDGLSEDAKLSLATSIGFTITNDSEMFTIIGASTWSGEEQLLINACIQLKQEGVPVRLLLVPRHSERRGEIRNILKSYENIRWQFRSQAEWKSNATEPEFLQVYVADTTGELRNMIQLADVAVIGKSFPPYGEGQTPVEAVALGVPVVYGGRMSNFRAICADLEQSGGSFRNHDPELLAEELKSLLENPEKRSSMVRAAREIFNRSRGSTERTFELIQQYMA